MAEKVGGDEGGEQQRWAAEMATAMAQASGVQAAPLMIVPLTGRAHRGSEPNKKEKHKYANTVARSCPKGVSVRRYITGTRSETEQTK